MGKETFKSKEILFDRSLVNYFSQIIVRFSLQYTIESQNSPGMEHNVEFITDSN